jgi:hypothetical protein
MRDAILAIACPIAFMGGLLLGWLAPSVWDSPGLDPCHAAVHRSFEEMMAMGDNSLETQQTLLTACLDEYMQ